MNMWYNGAMRPVVLAIATVHTTGINWGSLSIILVTIIGSVIGCATFVTNRMDKNRDTQRSTIMEGVHSVTDILVAQLKDVNSHLSRQDGLLKDHNDTLTRLQIQQARADERAIQNDQNARTAQERIEGARMTPDEQISREPRVEG